MARTYEVNIEEAWNLIFSVSFADILLDNYFELVQDVVRTNPCSSCLRFTNDVPAVCWDSRKHMNIMLTVILSAVGAKNFLFINVPPVDRSPLVRV